jgi:Uncharacterized protein conserved in cyanobacteria
VRRKAGSAIAEWANAPTPILIVEILSGSTRRRDRDQKRSLYLDARVDEYWVVDPEAETTTSIRRDRPDVVAAESFAWTPPDVVVGLEIEVPRVFGHAG